MQAVPVSILPGLPSNLRSHSRTALVASADRNFRQRLAQILTGLRWQVREAEGGAQAWADTELAQPEAVIVDSWLPDLYLTEFLKEFRGRFPQVDVVGAGSSMALEGPRGPYRQELLYALQRSQDTDTAAWNATTLMTAEPADSDALHPGPWQPSTTLPTAAAGFSERENGAVPPEGKLTLVEPIPISMHMVPNGSSSGAQTGVAASSARAGTMAERLPELIGNAACMIEVSRRVRLVAPRMTPVLIEGPTGSGKELVAEALHRLSSRSRKPFVAINCAAIPEALLEAELFGHTRGAFTGAVQGRVGRIESADGGTLFLDEIGEMPFGLQSKLLRFVECGELQRVGDNETVKVDVRIIAATHRPLAQQTQTGTFRSDLYYRLAVFLIRTPSLSEHAQDLALLVEHFMRKMGRDTPLKRLDPGAVAKLTAHDWPGNVRELEHVLERAVILAGDEPTLTAQEIDFGLSVN